MLGSIPFLFSIFNPSQSRSTNYLRVPVQSTGSFPSTQGERTVPSEHAGKYCHPDWNVESHISNHLNGHPILANWQRI